MRWRDIFDSTKYILGTNYGRPRNGRRGGYNMDEVATNIKSILNILVVPLSIMQSS